MSPRPNLSLFQRVKSTSRKGRDSSLFVTYESAFAKNVLH